MSAAPKHAPLPWRYDEELGEILDAEGDTVALLAVDSSIERENERGHFIVQLVNHYGRSPL